MTDTPHEPVLEGPCIVCGATNYPLSMGGPTLCPSCDCGIDPKIAKLQAENQVLQAQVESITKSANFMLNVELTKERDQLQAQVDKYTQLFDRHQARERYISDMTFQHIKHGDEQHQLWLRQALDECLTMEGKPHETVDQLKAQVAELEARWHSACTHESGLDDVEEIRQLKAQVDRLQSAIDYHNTEYKTVYDDRQQYREAMAALTREHGELKAQLVIATRTANVIIEEHITQREKLTQRLMNAEHDLTTAKARVAELEDR